MSDGVARGFQTAIEELGLGRLLTGSPTDAFGALVDALAPEGSQLEEAAARRALVDTMEFLFERVNAFENGIERLDELTGEDIKAVLTEYVSAYTEERIKQVLINSVERGTIGETAANQKMRDLSEFIRDLVQLDLRTVDFLKLDWHGKDGASFTQEIFRQAYEILGEAE